MATYYPQNDLEERIAATRKDARMTLLITPCADGSLDCYVVEHDYSYRVASWSAFFSATGSRYLADYNVRVL